MNQNTQAEKNQEEKAKRRPGRPAGTGNFSKERMEEDTKRVEPVMERVRAAIECGIRVSAICDVAGVSQVKLSRVHRRIGRYYGNWKEHLTFTDAELAAISKAIDDIKAAL